MTRNEYNGWTNYETWAVKLWMDNEEGSYNYWKERTQGAYEDATGRPSANARLTGVEPFTTKERAALALRDMLKEEREAALPEVEGFAADLLNAAVSEVNWHEIALSLLEDYDDEPKAEETEETTA